LAGEYPGDPEDEQARRKLRRLLEACITLFLDLTETGEHALRPYAQLLQEEAAALGQPITHLRLPIPDYDTPSSAQMKRILDTLDAALQAGQVIYVHCFGGIGRTGTVIGCYLVRLGLSGEEALSRIAALRRDTPDGWQRSPETAAQRQMVLNWAE
jgi:protein-tyrosine phosphatase